MNNLVLKNVTLAYVIFLIAFLMATRISDAIYTNIFSYKGLAQGIILSVITISSLLLLRAKSDKYIPKNIGLNNIKQSLLFFAFGISIYLIPIIISLLFIELISWGEIAFNSKSINSFLIGIVSVFLFEALPEEFVFRGYIYSNLNVAHSKWKAALISVVLFVSFPVVLTFIDSLLLKNEIMVGGENSLTLHYVIVLFIFGCFITYLRILTKSIWTGIGFHLLFVYYNRLFGTRSTDLIQISSTTNDSYKIVFLTAILLIVIALFIYPRVSRYDIKWKERIT